MTRLLMISIICLLPFLAAGQQDPMFTKYMFNSLVFNPAYAGSQGNVDVNASFRRQWIGIDGSPATILLSTEGALNDKNIGLGLTLFHDRIGVERRTDVSTNYSYIIDLPSGRLLLGLKAGMALFGFNFADLQADQLDPYYQQTNSPANLYFGTGVLYQHDVFFVALATPNLIAVDLNGNDLFPTFIKRHFYAQTGAWIDLGDSGMQFRPSLLLSFQEAAPVQAHLNAGLLLNEYFAMGVSYRTGDALNASVTIYPNSHLRIGLGYDFTVSKLRPYTDATFEVMVGYSFGEQVTKIDNPR
ncbi:MAG: type IX secretion system membrane protein PorP/SprF [Saprospiraceae bacterium]|nr:type IX secretion system membrane protein PorP/SprF [Saprospiraceae bacterium]